MSKARESSSVMPEVSRSLVPQTEVGPNYFAYHIREIEELFRQEDFIPSLSSKAFARTGEDVKDNNNVDNNLYESREAAGPSSRALFDKSLGDNLSLYTNDRLKASIKQGATVLSQEVDEMLHPVIRMYKIRKYLTDHERVANNPSTADRHVNQSAYKKQKLFSSPSPTAVATPFGSQSCEGTSGSESMDTKDPNIVSSGESQSRGRNRVCIDCKTTNSPQWRLGPTGARNLCNACGLRYKKKKLSPSGIIKAEDTLKQEADELQILVSAGGSYAKETVKKYSDEFFAKLEDMEQQLEKYLNVIMSKCRMMTREEKQELRRLIQNLPPKNLDRVVEIIVQHRKLPEGHPCDEIHIDLEEEDNVTLWRLYYYVKAVENAKAKSDE